MDSLNWLVPLASTLNAGTVLALAGLGLLIHEKVGVINLGAEGMLLCAALAAYAAVVHTGSFPLGLLAGAVAGALLAGIFAVLTIFLHTNPYASGLALSLFGMGFSAYAGRGYVQASLPTSGDYSIDVLANLPLIGPLFQLHPLVYIAMLLAWGMSWFYARTRPGLLLRAIGESPEAAHALGYHVRGIRLLCTVLGGALCGLAGAYLSTIYSPLWAEGMVAGQGWIALALTAFATWRPRRILLGAYLFGGMTVLQLDLQASGVQIPSQFLSMLPYLVTIVVLVLISRNPAWIRANMPASLGQGFSPR